MTIFAYGSNMLRARIRERVPSATFINIGYVSCYEFRFNKRSNTNSSKSNAFQINDPNARVWGVLWDIDDDEKLDLDRAEGLGHGYDEVQVDVTLIDGVVVHTLMYVAADDAIDNNLLPFTWYKDFVIAGAQQHNLPDEYIQSIAALPDIEDPNRQRHQQNHEILRRDVA